MAAIQAHDLVCEHAPGRGVCGLSLIVERGECFALLGRNGSGKTTLTRLLLGLENVTSGSLTVLGSKHKNGSRRHRQRLGAVLDTSVHWEQLSGWANAFFSARSYDMPRSAIEARLKALFALADLDQQAQDPVSSYSFGMRRKLSLIQALCHDPELLILDEPTSGVDIIFLSRLGDLVKQRSLEGKTTWIAGNDPNWISNVATRVAFMDSGKICSEGTVEELIREVSPFQEIQLRMDPPVTVPPPSMKGVCSFQQTGETVTAILERSPELIPLFVDWIVRQGGTIRSLEVRKPQLRDAFLLKTGYTLEP